MRGAESGRQSLLQQTAVDTIVGVQHVDAIDERFLTDRGVEVQRSGMNADMLARFALAAHIDPRVGFSPTSTVARQGGRRPRETRLFGRDAVGA